jgi:hypothetical protein
VDNDCSGSRGSKDIDLRLKVNRVIFKGKKELPVYSQGEPVNLKIRYDAEAATDNVAFRLVLETMDKTRVALATTKPCIHADPGTNEITLGLVVDHLAPGKYNCIIVAYSVNEFGAERVHDRVEKPCVFEKVLYSDEINRMEWNATWWGHMMLPEVTITSN